MGRGGQARWQVDGRAGGLVSGKAGRQTGRWEVLPMGGQAGAQVGRYMLAAQRMAGWTYSRLKFLMGDDDTWAE